MAHKNYLSFSSLSFFWVFFFGGTTSFSCSITAGQSLTQYNTNTRSPSLLVLMHLQWTYEHAVRCVCTHSLLMICRHTFTLTMQLARSNSSLAKKIYGIAELGFLYRLDVFLLFNQQCESTKGISSLFALDYNLQPTAKTSASYCSAEIHLHETLR